MRKLLNSFKLEYAIVLLVFTLILVLDLTQNMLVDILIPVSILSLLGLVSAFVLPNVLLTWLIIFVTIIGSVIMMVGIVYLPFIERLVLIFTIPVFSMLGAYVKSLGGIRGSALSDQNNIITYTNHVNSVTKLKNKKNAARFYAHYLSFIRDAQNEKLTIEVICINWAHNRQYMQLNSSEYNRVLKKIADSLKKDRLPDEVLYYTDPGTFLIFSTQQHVNLKNHLDRKMKGDLDKIKYADQGVSHDLQYKYAYQSVNAQNIDKFNTFKELDNNLKRQFETDIVVEYQ
ncbi:hypothetical protein [Liquorilactobacillus satsumensis]|uniref:hypothetical protein n=1 Tax=Liquorilactobacillus satsumensis TaxID=259059 RepID=UPI0021C304D0|nr:hypothetical protein [Liquorilactobacillus satsumensis]MCP9328570.1 hypothetical protein [Liquorilactobacillus satsumensis]